MSDSGYPDALPSQYHLHWYVIHRVLGQGGFGITYLAQDSNLDQTVAIKEYLPIDVATRRADTTVRPRSEGQGDRYRWGLERFIREARTLARFDHPNIVRVLSVFEHNGTAYMVMRFEEGENLAALLERRRTLPEDELMRLLLPILGGLELVHNAGFIHRDIKPDNIHVRADGTPVLLDFGSARSALGQARTMTILVAPGYAPFEQYYAGGDEQGPWTDIYSLGATCYHAIAGVAPMDAITRSKGILGSTREMLVPATAIGSGRYSEQLLRAVDHALAFAEKDRPASIAHWRGELPGSRSQASPAALAGAEPAPAAPRRRRRLVAATVAVAILTAAAIALLWMQKRDQEVRDLADRIEAIQDKNERARAEAEAKRVAEEEARRREAEARAQRDAPAETAPPPAAAVPPPKPPAASAPAKPRPIPAARAAPQAPPPTAPATVTAAVITTAVPVAVPPAAPAEPRARYEHFKNLALAGDGLAAFTVAEMVESGRGVAQNSVWACGWYELALRRGFAAAKPRKEAITARLQTPEIRQCQDWADANAR